MPTRSVDLEARRGDELLKKHELKGRSFFILGRQPGMSHVLVEDDTVSRQHAALVHCKEELFVLDLKSAKGVLVGGKRIRPMEPRKLAEGDVITLGELAVQYVVKGLGAPAASSGGRWQPPAWAVVPSKPVMMRLMRGETQVQELDLSRKAAYVMGRNGQQADLVVPHDSVSRQHAAVLHGAAAADGGSSVHVVDLKSTMGTFIDQGSGWKRLPPNAPTILPVGGRVKLGECSTLLVYTPPAVAAPQKPVEVVDDSPRFASMLQSTVVKAPLISNGVQPAPSVDLYEEESSGPAPAEEARRVDADGAAEPQVSNNDIRNMLLPFIRKAPVAQEEDDGGAGRKRKKKKRKNADDSSDDEREPPPPVTLDKLGPAEGDLSGGLVLRKQKVATKSTSSAKKSTMKIKF